MSRISIEKIDVGYGQAPIISDLSYVIPDGKIITIIGSNGCGKSTLLKTISRMIPHEKGKILLDGENIHKTNTKALALKMTMLSQKMVPVEGMTIKELVSYGRYPHRQGLSGLSQKDEEAIDWALKVTEIDAIQNQEVNALSGGQLQRAWIAMALAQETDIILLDEPTTYLDMAHQLEVLKLLKKLNLEEKRSIIMVLHDINQAARFSDYIIAMKSGEIVADGTPEEVMTQEVLKKVFNINAYIGKDPITQKPMCISYTA